MFSRDLFSFNKLATKKQHYNIYIYMLYDYIIVCYVHPNSPKQQLGLFQNLAFLVVFDRKLAWNERHDGHDPRCALGALVGFWMILQVLDVPPVKGQFQLPFIYPFSHNHGSVENYPK